jgi:pimeloyl-ACP methyl ester carboxylesterase
LLRRSFVLLVMAVCLTTTTTVFAQDEGTDMSVTTGYASVNGLNMYYEIHGSGGTPLVVMHGAYMSIESMGALVTSLAQTRQVIAVELQGHGRTADIDRPLSPDLMADDIDALLQQLNIEKADVFGYSLGGATALHLAMRHPERVNKLVVTSTTYASEGWYPELLGFMDNVTPELFAGSPMEAEYQRLAPNPENFSTLVEKLTRLAKEVEDMPEEDLQAIASPTLVIVGDSDNVRPEHALALFKLRGGGVPGDLTGLPNAQLAVIPGATHITVLSRVDLLTLLITEFLDAPVQEAATENS